jgi:hypothetical protein
MFALRIVFLHYFLPLLGTVFNVEFGSFSDVALLRLGAFAAFRLEGVQQDFCSNRRKLSVLDLDLVGVTAGLSEPAPRIWLAPRGLTK